METCWFGSPIGWLRLTGDSAGLTSIQVMDGPPKTVSSVTWPHLEEAIRQLGEYFRGELKRFVLPLNPEGTPFQRDVWRKLVDIPFGTTMSYQDLARHVGKPGGARAVGMANNRNPLPIVVPCHRVIGKDGSLVGYAMGLDAKRTLLRLEGLGGI